MRTVPATRKRFTTTSMIVSGGNRQILAGLFGSGSPSSERAAEQGTIGGALYQHHLGDVFYPGADGWVFDPAYEVPTTTIWANGILCFANAFQPLPSVAPIWVMPLSGPVSGFGGYQNGQWVQSPLIDPSQQNESAT